MSPVNNTPREQFLLNVITYLDEMDPWYLEQAPQWIKRLREEYGLVRSTEEVDA